MSTAPCDHAATRLLPWFVTGRLDADERARVEAHLASCAACRADLEHERALRDLLHEVDRDVAPGATAGFQKLIARIDETERALSEAPPDAAGPRPRRRSRPHAWFVAAVFAQACALALVGVALWRQADRDADAPYRTLTSDSASSAATGAHLRVVFAPGTTTHELAEILGRVDARIVDGPSTAGAYALALSRAAPGEAVVTATLETLRADARVILAEPIRAEPAP